LNPPRTRYGQGRVAGVIDGATIAHCASDRATALSGKRMQFAA